MKKYFWFIFALLLPTQSAFAMGEQFGRLAGVVYSPNGAELPGVKVTLTSSALMGARILLSTEDGSFIFNNLPPGKYDLLVENDGLRTFKKTGVFVNIGRTTQLYIAMEFDIDKQTTTMPETIFDTYEIPRCNFSEELPEELPQVWPVMQDIQSPSVQKIPKQGQSLESFVLELPRVEVKASTLRMNGQAASFLVDGQLILPQMTKQERH